MMRVRRENPSFLPGTAIPAGVGITNDLLGAARDKEMIVAAVPSQFLRNVMAQLKHLPLERMIVVNVAKGIENGTLMTMSEMLRDALPGLSPGNIATLSGPSHAEEVCRRIPTAIVAASTDLGTSKAVQSAFMVPYFRVYASTDLRGVETGGFA